MSSPQQPWVDGLTFAQVLDCLPVCRIVYQIAQTTLESGSCYYGTKLELSSL